MSRTGMQPPIRRNEKNWRFYGKRGLLTTIFSLVLCVYARSNPFPSNPKFEISFPASMHQQPITGRMFVIISRKSEPEPRLQVDWVDCPPVFAVDVDQLKPGEAAVIDAGTLGYPLRSIKELPNGDYYVQALLNVYTEFHRADGHAVWAHMDQWEGQQFNRSPGNFFSQPKKVHLDPSERKDVKLSLVSVIPPVEVPADTEWVKHVKIQSKLVTQFWGYPIYLGAVVLLPKGYASHPGVSYPVVYYQDHFNLDAPFNFTPEKATESDVVRRARQNRGLETGYEFYESWNSDHFPRMIVVTFLHPTPYFDDSYAVNSANNGPYGDALMTELIPYIEQHFRIIRRPYARVLTGGSTGGWESLALQLFYPEFFGGTWTCCPDPVDFRRYDLVNIYTDENAFTAPSTITASMPLGFDWLSPERYFQRRADGQPEVSVRQLSHFEAVLGSKGRSGKQLEIWEAVYGPVGDDGYPKPLWDKMTGKINHDVAKYMRDHGYDLRYYTEMSWPKIGPKLVRKLHFFCGDMDDFYLNLGVYLLEDFLKNATDPYYDGSFEYGRPLKPHGWQPMTNADLIKAMTDHITKNAPAGEDVTTWKYH
jgi:hypothetical protein